ncbi:hypothetical protein ACSTS3_21740 [Aquimarina muelleri]|uniref:hypothetical protein n=1 Tax=Aquimarina muelleri TaxID=279356 RepID=UPI003F685226
MKTELIPVIEIGYHNQGIKSPENYPYWEFPDEWQNYADKSYVKAGFKDKLIPYKKGSGFYRAKDITKNNLAKIVNDHFEGIIKEEWNEDETCALFGGYVLRINGEDKLFPQCCGDLSDIVYWETIAKYKQWKFYNGHPTPEVEFNKNNVIFNCKNDNEDFIPKTDEKIEVPILELEKAYDNARIELKEFEFNIKQIESNLFYKPIKDQLENILIYRNQEIDIDEVKKLRPTMAIVNTGFWHKIKGLFK